jgi:lipoprotein NlpD
MRRGVFAAGLACLVGAMAGCRSAPAPVTPPVRLPPSAKPSAPPGYVIYEVKKGDTLYSLAERFGMSWQEIRDGNELKRPEDLRAGTTLLIRDRGGARRPAPPAPLPQPSGPARTVVAKEDLHRGDPAAQFWWPTQGRLVRRYGDRVRGLPEPGIGIAAPAGLEVCAVRAGTVTTVVRSDPSSPLAWGNSVAISHAGAMVSWYGQLGEILVKEGDAVAKGQPIGTLSMGAGGRPELSFRLFRDERPVDPEDYLP